jgi:hypothetical protein
MGRFALALPGLVILTVAVHPSAQGIFREPARGTRAVDVVEGARQPPVELTRAELRLDPIGPNAVVLRALARQPGAGPRWDRLEVRLAFRLDDGVRTYPLTARSDSRVTLEGLVPVEFRLAPQTPAPSLLEWSEKTPVAVTIERITGADGTELWANPDARSPLAGAVGDAGAPGAARTAAARVNLTALGPARAGRRRGPVRPRPTAGPWPWRASARRRWRAAAPGRSSRGSRPRHAPRCRRRR